MVKRSVFSRLVKYDIFSSTAPTQKINLPQSENLFHLLPTLGFGVWCTWHGILCDCFTSFGYNETNCWGRYSESKSQTNVWVTMGKVSQSYCRVLFKRSSIPHDGITLRNMGTDFLGDRAQCRSVRSKISTVVLFVFKGKFAQQIREMSLLMAALEKVCDRWDSGLFTSQLLWNKARIWAAALHFCVLINIEQKSKTATWVHPKKCADAHNVQPQILHGLAQREDFIKTWFIVGASRSWLRTFAYRTCVMSHNMSWWNYFVLQKADKRVHSHVDTLTQGGM